LGPAVVATLGGQALAAVGLIEPHGLKSVNAAVARPVPWFGRWLYPLFHTGLLARNGPKGRSADQQRSDWHSLRAFLAEQGVLE
jgi:hypothetical protein